MSEATTAPPTTGRQHLPPGGVVIGLNRRAASPDDIPLELIHLAP